MTSSAVGEAPAVAVECGSVLLKWPQYYFASMAFWKWSENIAQFRPDASSFRINNAIVSARVVVVTADIADKERDYGGFCAKKGWGPITCESD